MAASDLTTRATGVCGMLALFVLAGPVFCQPQTDASAPGQSAPGAAAPADQNTQNAATPTAQSQPGAQGQLAEVVVTAEIRQTTAQSTPISMSVVTGDQIIAKGIINMADLQSTTPNFTVDAQGSNSAQINIRGVGINALVAGITPGVAILRDGLLDDEVVGASVTGDLFDIQNVSVLKGPQGTFVAASAIGGAVEINSRDPVFGPGVSGYIDGQLGNYSDIKTTGAVNMPVSDTFAARLAFNYEQQGSFATDLGGKLGANQPYKNCCTDQNISTDPGHVDNKNLRLGLLWKPSDRFQALLKINYTNMSFGGIDEQINPATFVNPITLKVTNAPFYADTLHDGPWVYDQYLTDQYWLTTMQADALELRFSFPDQIVLRSLSGWQDSLNNDYVAEVPPAYINTGTTTTDISPDLYLSQELDLISPTSWPVNFITGASWFYRSTPVSGYTVNQEVNQLLPTYTYGVQFPRTSVQRIMGLYANVNWQINGTLQLTAGGRANFDNNFNYGKYATTNSATRTTTIFYNDGHVQDSVPTGKIGLNWTPSHGQLIYIFVARGYKAAALSTGSADPNHIVTAQPEHDLDYELGWKGSLLNGHLQTDIDGFYMNYQNMQESVWNTSTGGTQLVNLASASTIDGVELEFDGNFGPVIADLSGAYTHSALGAVTAIDNGYLPAAATGFGQCQTGQAPPACFNYNAVGPTGLGYYVNISGEENPLTPKYSVNAVLGYQFKIHGNSLVSEVTEAYVASQYSSLFEQNNYFRMAGYALFGANVTYNAGPWQLAAYGKNLFNKLYEEGNSGSYVFYGDPRQFGVRIQRTF